MKTMLSAMLRAISETISGDSRPASKGKGVAEMRRFRLA
jgi:hypothetical protein